MENNLAKIKLINYKKEFDNRIFIGTSSEYPAPNAFGAGMKDDNIIIFTLPRRYPAVCCGELHFKKIKNIVKYIFVFT